jgi:general secretion pathway protein D
LCSSKRLATAGFVLFFPVLLAGCMGNIFGASSSEESQQALQEGRYESGLALLEQAAKASPNDAKIRATLARERLLAANKLSIAGEQARREGRFEEAEQNFRRALGIEAGHARATQGLTQIGIDQRHRGLLRDASAAIKKNDQALAQSLLRTVLAQEPGNREAQSLLAGIEESKATALQSAAKSGGAFGKPVTLEFRDAPLKTVFEVLSRSSGVNFVFDRDVKGDAKVTIFVRNTALEEVIRLILATNQLEKRQLNDNAFLIYPNTPAKAKDYQELALRTFFLSNTEAKQVQTMLKTVLKIRDVHVDEKLNLVIVRDTPQAIELAEKLVASVDIAEPEVMLELEVLEINRSRLKELGVRFPDQIGYGKITPDVVNSVLGTTGNTISQTTTFGGALAPGFIDTRNATGLTTYVANPALMLNLRSQLGDSNLLANPRIRVRNREKAKIHIGDKLPVFTTTSTANVGVSASVSYLDVGLRLEVEPQVYLEDDVSIKVGLEVSSVTKEVAGPSNSLAYQIGTRNTNTILRLRNGETQILAGLISDEERSSGNRLPGLGDLPLVGRLFGSQSDLRNKTEIILLITPRVVRNIVPPDNVRAVISAGTENVVGAAPMTVKNSPPRSLSMSATAGNAAVPAPSAPEAPVAAPAAAPVAEPAAAPVEEPAAAVSAPPPAAVPVERVVGGPPPTVSTDTAPLLPPARPASGGNPP